MLLAGGAGVVARRDTALAMSQENVEIVRRMYPEPAPNIVAVLADPNLLEASRKFLAPIVWPDFETVGRADWLPLAGTSGAGSEIAVGPEGFIRMFSDWLEAFESWEPHPVEFIDAGEDRVLVLLDVRAKSKTHQADLSFAGANLVTVKDGRVARLELFFDRESALKAAGLQK